MNTVHIQGLDDLAAAVEQFIPHLHTHKIVALYGKMGAGKTTFIKALCDCIGVNDDVNSPTFSLVNEYKSDQFGTVYHFDFYRIEDVEEAFDLGYEDYFYSNAICLIEWPEKIEPLLPEDALKMEIIVNKDNSRTVTIV